MFSFRRLTADVARNTHSELYKRCEAQTEAMKTRKLVENNGGKYFRWKYCFSFLHSHFVCAFFLFSSFLLYSRSRSRLCRLFSRVHLGKVNVSTRPFEIVSSWWRQYTNKLCYLPIMLMPQPNDLSLSPFLPHFHPSTSRTGRVCEHFQRKNIHNMLWVVLLVVAVRSALAVHLHKQDSSRLRNVCVRCLGVCTQCVKLQ